MIRTTGNCISPNFVSGFLNLCFRFLKDMMYSFTVSQSLRCFRSVESFRGVFLQIWRVLAALSWYLSKASFRISKCRCLARYEILLSHVLISNIAWPVRGYLIKLVGSMWLWWRCKTWMRYSASAPLTDFVFWVFGAWSNIRLYRSNHPTSKENPSSNLVMIYSPLNESNEIWLLHLQPHVDDGLIKCTIEHTKLSEKPRYEALSYM